jgi:RNase P/RNase MRP subunit p30
MLLSMQILNTPNLNEARKQIEKLRKAKEEGKLKPEETVGVLGQDDEFNRKALEIKGLNVLIINEEIEKKDYSKQRNSSLNEVLCEICKQKGISIAIEIEKIQQKTDKEKAKSLARLAQNIMLCKKAGCKLIFLQKNKQMNKRELQSLMLVLGASTKQAQEAQERIIY